MNDLITKGYFRAILLHTLKIICVLGCLVPVRGIAQETDTFFLAKKKGLLGKIGRSLLVDEAVSPPRLTVNPFLRFAGKKINSIEIVGIGFSSQISDSVRNQNFFLRLADALHRNTSEHFIRNNLFFKEGDYLIPLLLADNERYLRNLELFQDAWIVVQKNPDEQLVDIVVVTKDIFSLGGSLRISSKDKAEITLRDENVYGTGAKASVSTLIDKERSPGTSFGAEFLKRNIKTRFINATVGFSGYKPALLSGLQSEINVYGLIEKPLVHRYKKWTGAFEISYSKSASDYKTMLPFDSFYRYSNIKLDLWTGYNLGILKKSIINDLKSFTHFISFRTFYTNFYRVPEFYKDTFNYNLANINGFLFSYNIFRQNYYSTNFIYGFGRNEEVPEGVNASLTAGWTNKDGKNRNYYGLNIDGNYLAQIGRYYSYAFKLGGFSYKGSFEDIDLLIGGDHFTALKQLSKMWRSRQFYSISIAKQFRHLLNNPLFLQSVYGLPYYSNNTIEARIRTTLKAEAVFFNMNKLLGFRFAPFAFTDFSLVTPRGEPFRKSAGYTGIGGGFRMRNENLVFGTVEFRSYYFPRTNEGMQKWRFEVRSNLRFRYNSVFIKRPDFVLPN